MHMSDDSERQAGATDPDQPRPATTLPDSDYSLSIEEVGDLYAQAGLARDLRTIQRYCRRGRLEARLVEFPYGEKYFITPTSVERHIAFLKELRQAAADRGEPRLAGASDAQEIPQPTEARPAATSTDEPRPTAANDEAMSRYVAHLEGENTYLREQSAVKDGQIKDLTERAHETNVLIGSLQKMLTPLLGGGGAERVHIYAPDEGVGDNGPAS
jgi:hypothetical protein